MKNTHIDKGILSKLVRHNNKLGIKRILKSLSYERAAELPFTYALIHSKANNGVLRILDVGAGDSILPSFLLKEENVDVTCLDKFEWVDVQNKYVQASIGADQLNRLEVVRSDLFEYNPESPFDIITCVSVIEHFPGCSDSKAMEHMASLLKSGGLLILTTPVNEGFAKEFYRNEQVYGEYDDGGTFYQRHYDVDGINTRLIEPSGLKEVERIFFGEYGYPFGQKFLFPQLKKNLFKVFYKWASPLFAKKFLTYSNSPVSSSTMSVDTASGIILVLTK